MQSHRLEVGTAGGAGSSHHLGLAVEAVEAPTGVVVAMADVTVPVG